MTIQTINITMNCTSIVLHTFSMLVSFYILILIIYRWHYNYVHNRRPSITSISRFDDPISLLLLANTYFLLIVYSATWLLLLIHTAVGDFHISHNVIYHGDSLACRIPVAIIFFLSSAVIDSFIIHALWSYIKVAHCSTLHTRKIFSTLLNHISLYILLILITWLISLVLLIPAFKTYDLFSYIPEQHRCLISFTHVRGFIYSVVSTCFAPVGVTTFIYSRLFLFAHCKATCTRISRLRRDLIVIKRMVTNCGLLCFTGIPTLFFIIYFIMTRKLHPFTDRMHELLIAVTANVVSIGFAICSSLNQLLPPKPVFDNRSNRVYRRLRSS